MFKVGVHGLFGHFKHKLWSKEGQESNCQFNFRPLKVDNRPDVLTAGGVRHTVGKLAMKGTTLL
jgi:hypothetical protein